MSFDDVIILKPKTNWFIQKTDEQIKIQSYESLVFFFHRDCEHSLCILTDNKNCFKSLHSTLQWLEKTIRFVDILIPTIHKVNTSAHKELLSRQGTKFLCLILLSNHMLLPCVRTHYRQNSSQLWQEQNFRL